MGTELVRLRWTFWLLGLRRLGAGMKDTYDFKGMGNDPDSHELLAIVPTVHH